MTEKKVIDNLMSLTDKTILFVAHRLSIAERTNRVIVLDQGKIIEVGSHQELIQAQGFTIIYSTNKENVMNPNLLEASSFIRDVTIIMRQY